MLCVQIRLIRERRGINGMVGAAHATTLMPKHPQANLMGTERIDRIDQCIGSIASTTI